MVGQVSYLKAETITTDINMDTAKTCAPLPYIIGKNNSELILVLSRHKGESRTMPKDL